MIRKAIIVVLTTLVIYFLSMLGLYFACFELSLAPCPNWAFHYIAACLAVGASILAYRTINRPHRTGKGVVRLSCPHCGLKDFDPATRFCPQCGEVVVGMLRFFSVRDWAFAVLGFLVVWWLLSALVPWVLRSLGVAPSPLRTGMESTLPFVLSVVNVTLRLRGKFKTRQLDFKARLVREGTHCQCGYSLTGNLSGVCPECGTEIKLT